jgi:hypothetical protein
VVNAKEIMRDVGVVYYLPNRDFTRQGATLETDLNTIQAFGKACRNDLRD